MTRMIVLIIRGVMLKKNYRGIIDYTTFKCVRRNVVEVRKEL